MENNLNQGASIEAERAYQSWQNEQPNRCWVAPWHMLSDAQRAEWVAEVQARRTPAAAAGAGELPPLPEAKTVMQLADEFGSGSVAYTPKQYREGQRAAIAADRAQRKRAALQEISDIGQEIERDVNPAMLTRCAAGRDGDCSHPQCPQARDGEPHKTQRNCPLDTLEDEE
jgi:hypothetical protein